MLTHKPTAGPQRTCARLARARHLHELGRTEAAKAAYLDVLHGDSQCAAALNELGNILERTGYQSAARSVYERAVQAHPNDVTGHGNLAGLLLDAGENEAAEAHYGIAVRLDPANVAAHQCLAVVALRGGDARRAYAHARIGFRDSARAWPYRGNGPAIAVLVLHSALGGNVVIDRYIDDRTFAKSTIVAEFWKRGRSLPDHAFIFNAIGDADRCGPALARAQALVTQSGAPVVNAPAHVRLSARASNAQRLAGIPGVRSPRSVTRSRAELMSRTNADALAAAGFPIIVRVPGFHTGQFCVLVEHPADLAPAVATLPGDELLVIEYIDVRAQDGTFCKYRVMIVDGELYPLHRAVSAHWKVHYFSSDMLERPDERAMEARFVNDMSGVLGVERIAALDAVAGRLGLDFGGIDFALDAAGDIVIFEANATMIALPPPPDDCWAYRREPVARIDAAVRRMLLARGARRTSDGA